MKNLLIMLLLSMMIVSCGPAKGGLYKDPAPFDKSKVFKAHNLFTDTNEGIKLLDSTLNVYKRGDTVWANNGIITRLNPRSVPSEFNNHYTIAVGNAIKYIILED